MHALSVSLLRAKQLPVITNGLGASPHAGSTCTIGVVTVRPLNRLPARLYFKLKPDPNNTFFFIFTCTTQYPWVLANLNLSRAMAPSKKKRTHTVFRDSSAHRSASTSKPRFVGEKVKLGELLLNTFSGEWGIEEGELLTPVLRTSNFNEDGSLNYSTPAMRCIPEGKVAKKRMVRGDIILEKSGGTPKRPVGIMAFYDSDALALCSNFNQVLRFDESRILPRFAFHQLRWLKDRNAFDRCTRKTTGLQNLQMKKLIELKLRVPQIEAQTSIATTLDEIVCDQRTLQQEIACLDSLVKSRFVEMFGDPTNNKFDFPVEKLGGLGLLERGKSKHRPRNAPELRGGPNGPYPLIQTGDIANAGTYLATYEDTYTELGLLQSRIWPKGTLCITIAANIAKTSILAIDACFPDSVVGFTTNGKVTNLFMHYWFSFFQSILEKQAPQAAQKNINLRILQNLDVIAPPLALQQEFADFVAQVDKSGFATHRDHPRASY